MTVYGGLGQGGMADGVIGNWTLAILPEQSFQHLVMDWLWWGEMREGARKETKF